MALKTLHDAFVEQLRDVYSAEKQLVKALPRMIKAISNTALKEAVQAHLEETKMHVTRVEQAMESLDLKVRSIKCAAMEGLLEEGASLLEDEASPEVLDALIIAAAQKVEHYEIATYGTICTWARVLGHDPALALLKQNMADEEAADKKLTKISLTINKAAVKPREPAMQKN